MAGRFLFRGLLSRMSRSNSLLGARPPPSAAAAAAATAGDPLARRALEAGIRTRSIFSQGYAAQAVSNNCGSNGYPASYFSTLPCTRAASFTDRMKLATVDSVRGKRTFSTKDFSYPEKLPSGPAEWEAARAADKAELDAWHAKMLAQDAAFTRFLSWIIGSWLVIWYVMLDTYYTRGKSGSVTAAQDAASGDAAVRNPDVK
ncbi:hypothetical protein ACP4OV_017749 [Aristida adscensionis]